MRVGLFIPCYVDAFHPEVGIATLELLERFRSRGRIPVRPNLLRPADDQHRLPGRGRRDRGAVRAGTSRHTTISWGRREAACTRFAINLDAVEQTDEVKRVRAKTFELVEFLHDILKVRRISVGRVSSTKSALHNNCSALRRSAYRKRLGTARACLFRSRATFSAKVKGIEFVDLARPDECCGFGGTFSVIEEAVSAKMGQDKVTDQHRAGARIHRLGRYVRACMHQQGCAERIGMPTSSSTSRRS